MFLLFLFTSNFILISGTPQICNKLFVSRYFEETQYGNMTVYGELELVKNKNSTTIFVTNVSVQGELFYGPPQSVCFNVEGIETVPPPGACSTSLDDSFNFSIQDPSFTLQIYFPNYKYNFLFYFGFADDSTFSYKDGTFFATDNSTFIDIETDLGIYNLYSQTCTSFIDAPIAPKNSSKCKTFKSQTSILNITDNYSIFASSYMTWALSSENQLEATGNYSAPEKYFFQYLFNDGEHECAGTGCLFNLKPGDKKLIISAAIERYVGFDLITYPIPMIARIIFRGNQILMKEGISFSPKNNCLYFNFPYSDVQVSTSKFCCIDFETN